MLSRVQYNLTFIPYAACLAGRESLYPWFVVIGCACMHGEVRQERHGSAGVQQQYYLLFGGHWDPPVYPNADQLLVSTSIHIVSVSMCSCHQWFMLHIATV